MPASCSRWSRSIRTVIVSLSPHVDDHLALADDGALVLADLVALRQVGIEIVLPVEDAMRRLISAFRPSPVRIACRTHSSLITGSIPGIAASTSETWLLGSPPNSVEAPENSLACGIHLGVDLQPEDDFPIAGCALDEFLRVHWSVHAASRLRCMAIPARSKSHRRPGSTPFGKPRIPDLRNDENFYLLLFHNRSGKLPSLDETTQEFERCALCKTIKELTNGNRSHGSRSQRLQSRDQCL